MPNAWPIFTNNNLLSQNWDHYTLTVSWSPSVYACASHITLTDVRTLSRLNNDWLFASTICASNETRSCFVCFEVKVEERVQGLIWSDYLGDLTWSEGSGKDAKIIMIDASATLNSISHLYCIRKPNKSPIKLNIIISWWAYAQDYILRGVVRDILNIGSW